MNVPVTFPGNVTQIDTIALLRGLPSAYVSDGTVMLVTAAGFYTWDAGAFDADDGIGIIRPNDVLSSASGRYKIVGGNAADVVPLNVSGSLVTIGSTTQTVASKMAANDAALAATNTQVASAFAIIPPSLKSYNPVAYGTGPAYDNTTVINNALAGGVKDFEYQYPLYFNGQITAPPGSDIRGVPLGDLSSTSDSYGTKPGAWIIGPSASSPIIGERSRLTDIALISAAAATSPVITGNATTDTANAVARMNAWTGTAFAINKPDVMLTNVAAIGFANGIVTTADRVRVYGGHVHCLNGLDISNVYDIPSVFRDISFRPYWVAGFNSLTADKLLPLLTGLLLHGHCDGAQVSACLFYGFLNSLHITGCNTAHINDCFFDGYGTTANARGTIGVLTEGSIGLVNLDRTHVDSHANNWKLTHTSGDVLLGNSESSGGQNRDIILGSGACVRGLIESIQPLSAYLIDVPATPGNVDLTVRVKDDAAKTALNLAAVTTKANLAKMKVTLDPVNSGCVDNTDQLKSYVSAVRTTDLTLPSVATAGSDAAALTNIILDSVSANNLGEYNATTGVFTPLAPGVYRVELDVTSQASSTTTGYYTVRILVAGAEYRRYQTEMSDTYGRSSPPLAYEVKVTPALETIAFQASMQQGGKLTAGACFLTIRKVA